jgi:two-component system sensor histidine kinase KdpD
VLLQRVLPAIVATEQMHWPDARFKVSIPTGLPPVMGDGVYVEHLVRNLLANAVKHGPDNACVEVVLEELGAEVVLRVLDEGPGIEPGHEELLFDLFYRSPRTSEFAPGAGIGLFVCSRLVRAMGGRIWAKRRPEGGAELGMALRVMRDE